MSKWRVWQDDFWGDQWNGRWEISQPQFEGAEIPDEEIEEYLLSYYRPDMRRFVEITGDEQAVYARLGYCDGCDEVYSECQCGEDACPSYIGYHAEKAA